MWSPEEEGTLSLLTLAHLQDSADTSRCIQELVGGNLPALGTYASLRGAAPGLLVVLLLSGACVGACNQNGQCLGDRALALLYAELSTVDGRLPRFGGYSLISVITAV